MSQTPDRETDTAESIAAPSEQGYEKPDVEQELRADLEETWQSESPETARVTDFADQVDGRLDTRNRPNDGR